MKSYLILFSLILAFSSPAMAGVDVYTGINVGSLLMKETTGGNEYINKSTFVVGHWGYSLGTRVKLDLGRVSVGGVGEVAWLGDGIDRTLLTDLMRYRFESQRTLAGAVVAFNTGASSILLEYLPWVQNTTSYSDKKAENPFRKNDTFNATGFGFGFNFGFTNEFGTQLLYRKLIYSKFKSSGVAETVPGDVYSSMVLDEITMGFVLRF